MKVRFWGVRGSYSGSIHSIKLREKLMHALEAAQGMYFHSSKELEEWVDKLPFWVTHNYGVNTSCVQIEAEGEDFVFCDAGSGLKEFSLSYANSERSKKPATFHFFISHLHWDHIQGFPFFEPLFDDYNRIVIHGYHTGIEKSLRGQMAEPYFPLSFDAVKAKVEFDIRRPDEFFKIGGYNIQSIKQHHPGDSYGYRFNLGEKSVVYSTDAEHRRDLDSEDYPFIDFFRDADLLIFDGQYSFAESIGRRENWGHSSNIIGVELAARAHVRHLVLFHLDPMISDEELDLCLAGTQRYRDLYGQEDPRNISVAYEGMVVEI